MGEICKHTKTHREPVQNVNRNMSFISIDYRSKNGLLQNKSICAPIVENSFTYSKKNQFRQSRKHLNKARASSTFLDHKLFCESDYLLEYFNI